MNDSQRKRHLSLLRDRVDRVREVIRVYDEGGMTEGKALSEIENIASGDADRVVRVGHQNHAPEVQS